MARKIQEGPRRSKRVLDDVLRRSSRVLAEVEVTSKRGQEAP